MSNKIGTWLKEARLRNNIKSIDIDDYLGLSRGSNSHYERGTCLPSDENMKLLCELYDLNPRDMPFEMRIRRRRKLKSKARPEKKPVKSQSAYSKAEEKQKLPTLDQESCMKIIKLAADAGDVELVMTVARSLVVTNGSGHSVDEKREDKARAILGEMRNSNGSGMP